MLENVRIATVYFFQIVTIIVFIKLLFGKNTGADKDELRKLIGGLIIFIIAIIADKESVYILSLFIGGLIIASESFMKFIFAIWRSDPKYIAKTVQSFSLPTVEEIKKKEKNEAREITENNNIEDEKIFEQKSTEVNNLVYKYFKKIYGDLYCKDIKIQNEFGSTIVDGAIMTKANPSSMFTKEELGKRNDLEFNEAVEIQFFQKKLGIELIIQRLLERLYFKNFILLYTIVIVVENINKDEAQAIYNSLLSKYSNRLEFKFYIFSYKDNKIELLNY